MRVTNSMMANQMLLNINRNMRRLDALYKQQSSGKLIQFPSENPILAGRALRFRTSVAETVQFQKNVKQGLSWMEVTQGAYMNLVDMFERMVEIVNTGASDTSGTWEDRQKMVAELQGIVEQLAHEMNISYAGRYVFSGYRTDEPPMFTQNNDLFYSINQGFTISDMEKTMSLQKSYNVAVAGNVPAGATVTQVNGVNITPGMIVERSISDPDSYNPAPGTINYLKETGEYVLSYDLLDFNFNPPATITTDEPAVYNISPFLMYTAEPIVNNINVIRLPYKQADITDISFKYNNPDGTVTHVPIGPVTEKSLSDPTAYAPGDDEIIHIAETGELIFGKNVAGSLASLPSNAELNITYEKEGFLRGEPNPVVYFECVDLNTGKSYNMNNQTLEFEFGINTRIQINALSKDTYTASMYAQLNDFCNFVMGVGVSDPAKLREQFSQITPPLSSDEIDELVNKQISRETKLTDTVLHDRFKNMIEIVQSYSSSISFQETNTGVRINRLQTIEKRLQQDYDTYKELLSDNEDANLIEVLTNISSAEAILAAAYKTGASIMKLSLVDFI